MPDLAASLAALGAAVVPTVAVPLLAWTALGLAVETSVRVARCVPPETSLALRRGLLFALPLAVALPFLAEAAAPTFAVTLPASARTAFELPGVTVGAAPGAAPTWTAASMWGIAVLGGVVLGGLGLARWLVAMVRVTTLRHRLDAAPPAAYALARDLAVPAGLLDVPDLAVGPPGSPPFTLGVRPALIVLPAGLDDASLRLVLAHEMAHVQRRDFGWTLAERAIAAAFTGHPLARVLADGAALDRECLADAAVLARRPAERRAYADLLLRFASHPLPALAVGVAGSSPLKHRLTAMSRSAPPAARRRARRMGRMLAAFVLFLTVGVGLSTAQSLGLAFQIEHPTVTVDGVSTTFDMAARTDALGVLTVDIQDFGRFVVSDHAFSGATPSGRFDGDRLSGEAGGHRLDVRSTVRLFPEASPTTAYLRFDAAPLQRSLAPDFLVGIGLFHDVATLGAPGLAFAPPPPPTAPAPPTPPSPPSAAPAPPPTPPAAPAPPPAPPAFTARPALSVADTTMPELVGGMAALGQAVVYPQLQKMAGIQGRTVVSFVVGKDGAVRDLAVQQSSGDEALDAAALAAVQAVRFRPGRAGGEAIAVQLAVPISFVLPADDE